LAEAQHESALQAAKEKEAAQVLAEVTARKVAFEKAQKDSANAEAVRIKTENDARELARVEAAKKEAFVKAANEKTAADLRRKQEEQAAQKREEAEAKKQKDDEYAMWLQSTVERNHRAKAEAQARDEAQAKINQWKKDQLASSGRISEKQIPSYVDWGKWALRIFWVSLVASVFSLGYFAVKNGDKIAAAEDRNREIEKQNAAALPSRSKQTTPALPVMPPSPNATTSTYPSQIIDGFEILDDPVLGKSSLARDTMTGLIWQRCLLGQAWDGSTCTGSPRKASFEGAWKARPSGWRVPTIYELSTLQKCSKGFILKNDSNVMSDKLQECRWGSEVPAINTSVFKTSENSSWSSTVQAGKTGMAWQALFDINMIVANYPSDSIPVRYVRNVPKL
jgi:hypothetical protein